MDGPIGTGDWRDFRQEEEKETLELPLTLSSPLFQMADWYLIPSLKISKEDNQLWDAIIAFPSQDKWDTTLFVIIKTSVDFLKPSDVNKQQHQSSTPWNNRIGSKRNQKWLRHLHQARNPRCMPVFCDEKYSMMNAKFYDSDSHLDRT